MMKENEYKNDEKVLYETKVRLSLPKKEPEEAECFITESNLVIEAEKPLRIPLHQIKGHNIENYAYNTMTLTYLDDANQKQLLSLEAFLDGASSLDQKLRLVVDEAKEKWLESQPIETRCAGFWRRFAANFLDGLILNIISWILGFVLSFLPYGMGIVVGILFFIGSIVYYPGFWVWQGATPGKMMMGVKIVKTDGSPIGIGRAILRYIGYFVSTITFFIGYLMIAWDGRKQGLHDKIAGTVVVKTR